MSEKTPSCPSGAIVASPLPQLTKQQWLAIAKIVLLALLQIAALFGFDLLPDLAGVVRRIVAGQRGEEAER